MAALWSTAGTEGRRTRGLPGFSVGSDFQRGHRQLVAVVRLKVEDGGRSQRGVHGGEAGLLLLVTTTAPYQHRAVDQGVEERRDEQAAAEQRVVEVLEAALEVAAEKQPVTDADVHQV